MTLEGNQKVSVLNEVHIVLWFLVTLLLVLLYSLQQQQGRVESLVPRE